jgi:hypothetical protein
VGAAEHLERLVVAAGIGERAAELAHQREVARLADRDALQHRDGLHGLAGGAQRPGIAHGVAGVRRRRAVAGGKALDLAACGLLAIGRRRHRAGDVAAATAAAGAQRAAARDEGSEGDDEDEGPDRQGRIRHDGLRGTGRAARPKVIIR